MTAQVRRIVWLLGIGACAIVGAIAVRWGFTMHAHRYLVRALDIIETHHVKRKQIDWAAIRDDVYQNADHALTPAQTHAAILYALKRIGDRHSGLIELSALKQLREVTAANNPAPESRLLPEQIGYVRIPSFVGLSEVAVRDEGTKIQQVIADVDRLEPCGWIVDLRGNGGGNMWPMLAGVEPILGDGAVGSFVDIGRQPLVWSVDDGNAEENGHVRAIVAVPYHLHHSLPPVAVLIGRATTSSGEAIAVAFKQRPNTRSFGTRTAGFSTSNEQFPLSDGAVLNLSTSIFTDRTGRLYPEGVEPDVISESINDSAQSAAHDWLARQQTCQNRPER